VARSNLIEQMKRELRDEEAAMSVSERIALALALGRRDVSLYAKVNDLSLEEASRRLRIEAQLSRPRPSRCILALDDPAADSNRP
jgi:hypothetical protein